MSHDVDSALTGRMNGATEPPWWHGGLPVLAGTRVVLREPLCSDAPALVDALSNGEVGRFMSRPPDTPNGFARFIEWVQVERQAGRCLCYGLVPAGTDRVIGLIQLRAVEPGFSAAEWGFALAPSHWGTGLFMDAARILLDFVFRSGHVHRLEARASVVNGRGNGVLQKLGAMPEGILRESLQQASSRVDQILWATLEEEWLRHGTAPPYELIRPAQPIEIAEMTPARPSLVRSDWRDRLPVLDGPTCVVREVEASDADDLRRMLGDAEVRRYTSPPPSTTEGFASFVEWSRDQRGNGRFVCFAIVPRSTSRAAGLIQVRGLEPSFQTAEWGFALGRPYWGTGLFREAAGLLLDFVFDTMGVHRLEARSVVTNARAIESLRRLGAVFEGRLRRSFLLGEQYHDDALYSLLAADWRTRDVTPRRATA